MLKEVEQTAPIKLREQLLVEKCINTLITEYRCNVNSEFVNAEIDFKLDFLSFLTTNLPEEVDYGIKYLTNFPAENRILMPMILEYRTYGLKGQLECKPIPECSRNSAPEEPQGIVKKIFNLFKNLIERD